MTGKTGNPAASPGSSWRAMAVAGIVLLSGTNPIRGEVVCYEKGVSIETTTGCTKITLTPLSLDKDTLQRLRAECEDRLARQKATLLENYSHQCSTYLEQEKQRWFQQARQQLEAERANQEAKMADQLQQCDAGLQAVVADRDRLRAVAEEAAPYPGAEALASFSDEPGRAGLAWLGGLAMICSFFLGMSGRHAWWAKLISGTVAALISLCVYLGIVYFLPDTRPTDLLLALAGGLLFASLGALLHLHLSPFPRQDQELGRRTNWRPSRQPLERRAASAPPATPAPAEPGRRTRWRPPPAGRAAPAPPVAPAPPAPRESDDEVVVDGYTLVPFDERDRQQPLFRCQGCERIYREASLQQMFRRTGGSCWQCGSRDIREYYLPS